MYSPSTESHNGRLSVHVLPVHSSYSSTLTVPTCQPAGRAELSLEEASGHVRVGYTGMGRPFGTPPRS
ncbi:hypothetical protein DPEC_G00291970 [Dallia pectoralis]|uniref:Uncharacterized protein n=1 Tax=Dallia pectoralis TaxID=75939 RepID=A0ACC2FHW2_DALPE|nr:hypothetical protein DPEC_G00291970 [Dallia pectoralis]